MVTAHDQDIDKLMALRIGADDYVVKPFNPAEVAARVRAVLRRTRRADRKPEVLRVGRWRSTSRRSGWPWWRDARATS
jgi:two-component system response regulator AdeR